MAVDGSVHDKILRSHRSVKSSFKRNLIREVAFLEENNLVHVVFNYLDASEIRPDKRGGL
jgi:hypothetical protein